MSTLTNGVTFRYDFNRRITCVSMVETHTGGLGPRGGVLTCVGGHNLLRLLRIGRGGVSDEVQLNPSMAIAAPPDVGRGGGVPRAGSVGAAGGKGAAGAAGKQFEMTDVSFGPVSADGRKRVLAVATKGGLWAPPFDKSGPFRHVFNW